MVTLTIPSSSNELDRVLDFISLGHEVVNCSIEFWMELFDTVQKVFINIVKYAYPTREGVVKITLNYIKELQAIEVSFIDEGIPYNPLEGLTQTSAINKDNLLEGTLGITVQEKSSEEMSYVYLNQKNITTIKKYLE